MAFNSINKQFTLPQFAAYLATLPAPAWHPIGTTYHNTYRPTEAQWVGLKSMQSMQALYVQRGWSAGPHLYLALGSPNKANDGIWIMTPPTAEGVHAGACNAHRFGVEVVGDFQTHAPSAAQQQLLIDALTALHRWAKIGPDLNAHRDCMERTCPGDAFYALKPTLQQRLAESLGLMLPGIGRPMHCSRSLYDFYHADGRGFDLFGYALADERPGVDAGRRVCTWMPLERAILKHTDQFGVELALLSEARQIGWIV